MTFWEGAKREMASGFLERQRRIQEEAMATAERITRQYDIKRAPQSWCYVEEI